MNGSSTIRLAAIIEATDVTGPARNLIEFCQRARSEAQCGAPVIETSIITYHRGGIPGITSAPPFVVVARAAGIDVTVIPERCRFDTSVIDQLRRAVERYSPDIIQTHNTKSHFLLRLSGLNRKYPWVIFHHGYTSTDLKMHLYNQLDYWSLRAADRVITVSEAFVRQMRRRGVSPERIRVVHNSIHPDWGGQLRKEERRQLRHRLGIACDESLILTVGRLSREKGHADLVRAFGYLCKGHPALRSRLLIVGDGPERERIQDVASEVGVKEHIIFAGHVSEVAGYYAAADLFVLPSHTEGSPNALLEAMAAELPIVATAVGGVPEIVTNDDTAMLVTPSDPQLMGKVVAQLISSRMQAQRLAANARATVVSRFSPEARLGALAQTYRQLWVENAGMQ